MGHDSNRVIDDSTNDKNGTLSHEGTDAAEGVYQGDGLEQSLDCGVKTPQDSPNEAKLELTQSTSSQGFESQYGEPDGPERSQFATGGEVVGGAGDDRVETIVPAGKGGGKARDRKGRSLPKAASATRVCSGELRSRAVESAGLARLCLKEEHVADPVIGGELGGGSDDRAARVVS